MRNGTVTALLNFILVLALVIPYINPDDEQILASSDSLEKNQSEVNVDFLEENISRIEPILEPSVEENIKVAIDPEIITKHKDPDTETDKAELPNSVSINDTPVSLSPDSSTVELDLVSEISVVLTSQKEEILSQQASDTPQTTPETIPELNQNHNIPINITLNVSRTEEKKIETDQKGVEEGEEVAEKNATESKTEDIPSFSEWAQKRLEEVEKNEQINSSVKGQVPNGKTQNAKLRWKNYASLDCGAKVVAANPEAVSPLAVLSPSSDEYKLNPCTARIWFVVELCEAIQAKRIDLANYELFSSSPKEFTVSVSERFPTRDWALIGKFTAQDERDIQSFDLETELFGKYIKVEIKSHYGSEHYCPISLFRAYGASVFEVLQKEDAANVNRPDDDDDDDEDENEQIDTDSPQKADKGKKNIFSSATDAVISAVKRAAQYIGTKTDDDAKKDKNSSASTLINTCSSPRHLISCKKCNETLFGQIYEMVSCKSEEIKRLVSIPTIFRTIKSSTICQKFGFNFNNSTKESLYIKNLESFFPEKYIGAMCNEVAILESKGVVNVSQHFTNVTKNLTNEKIVNMKVDEIRDVPKTVEPEFKNSIIENQNDSRGSTQEEILQIKPTKTLTVNNASSQTDTQVEASEGVVPMETVTEIPDSGTAFTEATTEGSFVAESDVSTEGTDVLDDQLNNIMVDLSSDGPNNVVASSTASSPQAAKESIFLRLFNRIKALERNMSISSQYLEELSKRYKKQVEEMREETLKRDELNKQLEERLLKLTSTIENMAAERRTFLTVAYCLLFFGFACFGIYFFCGQWTARARHREGSTQITRRKSLDELKDRKTEKKRRPSDQVLKIVRYSSLNEESLKKKRKRKKPIHHRSISLGNIKLEKDKMAPSTNSLGESRPMVEEVPVVLDECENSILEGCELSKEVDAQEVNKSSQNGSEVSVSENNSTFPNIIDSEPVKKEKKGFKRLLRKVF